MLQRFLPYVEDVVESYLAPDERVIMQDSPALGEFFLLSLGDLAVVAAVFLSTIPLALTHHRPAAYAAAALGAALAFRLVVRRFGDYYTAYVITDLRIMRVSGIISRVAYSIPLGKITDVAFSQRWWERWGPFGSFGTIEIDSASEKSGLDKLRGLHNPARFSRLLLSVIADKQGFVVPGTAALNKRRTREDHLKLNIRFDRPLSEFFFDPDEEEWTFARAGVERDLAERDERMYRLRVMRRMADNLDPLPTPGGLVPDLGDEPDDIGADDGDD